MSDTRIRPGRLFDDAALTALDHATWSALHAVQPRPAPDARFFDLAHPMPGRDHRDGAWCALRA